MQMHQSRPQSDYLSIPEIRSPRILLAEDDSEMRALVSDDLRRAGYGVVECAHGAALLRKLEAASDEEGLGVDLVIADLRMPEVTGLEVLERLRGADPFTPFILVTAFGSEEIARAAHRLGAILLDKPFASIDLLHLVEETTGIGPRLPR
jgi:CheY-like chemotaxis protein